jgi:hypothetical protein
MINSLSALLHNILEANAETTWAGGDIIPDYGKLGLGVDALR